MTEYLKHQYEIITCPLPLFLLLPVSQQKQYKKEVIHWEILCALPECPASCKEVSVACAPTLMMKAIKSTPKNTHAGSVGYSGFMRDNTIQQAVI